MLKLKIDRTESAKLSIVGACLVASGLTGQWGNHGVIDDQQLPRGKGLLFQNLANRTTSPYS